MTNDDDNNDDDDDDDNNDNEYCNAKSQATAAWRLFSNFAILKVEYACFSKHLKFISPLIVRSLFCGFEVSVPGSPQVRARGGHLQPLEML